MIDNTSLVGNISAEVGEIGTHQNTIDLLEIICADLSEKEAYGYFDVMQANDVDDLIYDVTLGNVQHAAQIFQQNRVNIYFQRYKPKINEIFQSIGILKCSSNIFRC